MVSQQIRERCCELSNIPVPKHEALTRFQRRHSPSHFGGDFSGIFGEIYTWLRVEELTRRHQDTSLFWMKQKLRAQSYLFQQKEKPNITIRRELDRKRIGEIDLVMLINDVEGSRIPVLIETHLAPYSSGGRCPSVSKMLRFQRVEKKRQLTEILFNNLDQTQDYHAPVVAYVVPQDHLKNLDVPESNMYQFAAQENNVVIPFHTTKEKWMKEVNKILAEYQERSMNVKTINGSRYPFSSTA